jgi:manganese efflux pump family protein
MQLEVILAGLVVGLDNLAAGMALGALGQRRRIWRIAAAFTTFGAVSPAVGALMGAELSRRIVEYGETAGAIVLGGLALWTLSSAIRESDADEGLARRVTSWGGITVLAASLSIDNLVVGFGLGLRGVAPPTLALAAGVAVLVFTVLGVLVGSSARRRWERWAHIGAGLVLLALAAATGLGWF